MPSTQTPTPITLEKLLASRDQRKATQEQLHRQYPNHTLVCMTVIMPGNIKRNETSTLIAREGYQAITEELQQSLVFSMQRDLITGFEAYLITSLPQHSVKEIACHIEDNHPLGRLFDIDVLAKEGAPLSRQSIGCPPRKCLICENESRFCMRNRTHTVEELLSHIASIVEKYKSKQ